MLRCYSAFLSVLWITVLFPYSVKLLSLMFELARGSSSFFLQCVQTDTMELLGYLLGKLSAPHLSLNLLSCLFKFVEYLKAAPNGSKLLCQVIEHLLFSPSMWIKAHKKVTTMYCSRDKHLLLTIFPPSFFYCDSPGSDTALLQAGHRTQH